MSELTFPELRGSRFGYLDLDLLSRRHEQARIELLGQVTENELLVNPFLDPESGIVLIREEQKRKGMDHSFCGFLEDRRHVLRGSYLEQDQTWIHIGVDFNVPAGTNVAATWKGFVECIDDDSPEVGGWGPRVVIRLAHRPNIILFFAHLGEILCKEKQVLNPGDLIATVGAPPNNGFWFPHLHVQAIDEREFKGNWVSLLHDLDGYIHASVEGKVKKFPDPMRFVRLRD